MAIINVTRAVTLTTQYLNLPVTKGMTAYGHWFYYTPANGGNTALGAKITPYQWGVASTLAGGASELTMQGTMPLITEAWDGANVQYHGSCITYVGPGVNDITNQEESDAYFFAHLGALAASDDVYYWDRIYLPQGGSEWDYYQYHAHSPTFYVTYENGRQVMSADQYIDPADKAYGYTLSSRVRVSGTNYTSVLARVHTPSIGGAHNSHNDVTLPTAGALNYLNCGIIRGVGERFHAFYITASSTQWQVFNRTYTDAAGSFTAQVSLGVYDLADPTFNPSSNQQSQYPIRASNGASFGARIYFPVILNNATSGFDLEIWSFNSLDTIAGGSLVRHVIAQQLTTRPDCMILNYGTTKIFIAYTDTINGGIRIESYDGTTWTDEGTAVTNNTNDPVRVHGFEFNSADFKFYLLLSGTASGGASTYLGPGMYTFELSGTFLGYQHLDYVAATNSFIERNALTAGYLKYYKTEAYLARINATEPQAIGTDYLVMDYTPSSGTFYNKKSAGFGGQDYYYHSITLKDGRRFASGQILNNKDNLGIGGDFLFSIYDSNLLFARHFAWGGLGADFFTGCWEDSVNKRIYLTGYSKSELVPKGDILIHGWARSLTDGSNAIRYKDLAIDSSGNVYCVGSHVSGYLLVTKYDSNYDLQWQRVIGDGVTNTDVGNGIALDSSGNIYIAGETQDAGAGVKDVLLVKMTSAGALTYAKAYGSASNESATSVAIIKKGGVEYVVMSVVSGTVSTFLVTNTSGTIVEQNKYTDLVVRRVRPVQSDDNNGRYIFAGDDGAVTKKAKFGQCQVLTSGATNMQWVRTFGGAQSYLGYDIVNTDQAVGGNNEGFVICGLKGTTDSFLLKVSVNLSGGVYTISNSWAKTMVTGSGAQHADCGLIALCATPYTEATRYVYAVGCTDISLIAEMGMEEGLITRWAASNGTLSWQNVFGHDMEEMLYAVANDATGLNIVSVGWSASHASADAGVIFRCENEGFGTGLYTIEGSSSMPYYYVKSVLASSTNTDTLSALSAPANSANTFTTATYSATIATSPYSNNNFNGAFGPNGLFNFILGYIDLELYQELLNSTDYQAFEATGCVNDEVYYLSEWTTIGKIWEAATVGDSSADDGNMFGYDIIRHSNGNVYAIGQTSGDVFKTNLGTSGVYDYLLVKFDPVTEKFEWYQGGTALDEETYALTELADGNIAYVGRTTGNLGAANQGGYDIFLGIFDINTETSTYYSTGSGLDDKGVNVHDLGNNELIVVYSTYGNLGSDPNIGSEDIGVIKFNYSTDTWGTAYQTGTTTAEMFEQNGKPSSMIGTNRVAITLSSAGIFADDAVTYGYLDVCLAILNLDNGTWKKFQIGSAANEEASSCTTFGAQLLIGGNSGGSFDDSVDAIFVEFDAAEGFLGKSSSLS